MSFDSDEEGVLKLGGLLVDTIFLTETLKNAEIERRQLVTTKYHRQGVTM